MFEINSNMLKHYKNKLSVNILSLVYFVHVLISRFLQFPRKKIYQETPNDFA